MQALGGPVFEWCVLQACNAAEQVDKVIGLRKNPAVAVGLLTGLSGDVVHQVAEVIQQHS